jgi:hypothetical protein
MGERKSNFNNDSNVNIVNKEAIIIDLVNFY